eukprot:TRINITY_DN164_c0_g1_i4.p1 TRINITY_DN164_c0_g1~~TRINITY_DN164_c0_g1_i4.p1  ORF type:complete len:109 (-),score=4.60 TRINITY_DN164_c0_g1_i4:492-818(-)
MAEDGGGRRCGGGDGDGQRCGGQRWRRSEMEVRNKAAVGKMVAEVGKMVAVGDAAGEMATVRDAAVKDGDGRRWKSEIKRRSERWWQKSGRWWRSEMAVKVTRVDDSL